MRMKFFIILKIAAISLLFLVIIYFFIPLKNRLDILIAVYPPMREELRGLVCGNAGKDQVTVTTWIMKGSSIEEIFDCHDHENVFVVLTVSNIVDRNREQAIPLLLDLAQNGTTEQRKRALDALGYYGPESLGVIDDLEQMLDELDEDDPWIRFRLVKAICAINPGSEAVIPVLLEMAESEYRWERTAVPWKLKNSIMPADEVIPILIGLLEDEDDLVRANSATALGHYGSRAEEALPALEAAYEQTEDAFTRERIAEAIKTIEGIEESEE